jgi:hypothetical protein
MHGSKPAGFDTRDRVGGGERNRGNNVLKGVIFLEKEQTYLGTFFQKTTSLKKLKKKTPTHSLTVATNTDQSVYKCLPLFLTRRAHYQLRWH